MLWLSESCRVQNADSGIILLSFSHHSISPSAKAFRLLALWDTWLPRAEYHLFRLPSRLKSVSKIRLTHCFGLKSLHKVRANQRDMIYVATLREQMEGAARSWLGMMQYVLAYT